jgi:protein-tyrosine phosphatase
MRHKIQEQKLPWTVASAGTASYHVGQAPQPLAQKVCQAHGIDISDLRASKFTQSDLAKYDKIYAFADDVYREIMKIGGASADMSRVDYFLNELNNDSSSGRRDRKNESVPDPYLGDEEEFKQVYNLIEKTCNKIIEKYK